MEDEARQLSLIFASIIINTKRDSSARKKQEKRKREVQFKTESNFVHFDLALHSALCTLNFEL